MRLSLFALFLLLSFPYIASAQTSSSKAPAASAAGFATAPLWLSSASPVAGDAVKIFAVVNNTSTAAVAGSVSFLVDGVVVGSPAKVSLAKGAAQLVSADWRASAGEHALTATFSAGDQTGEVFGTAGPVSVTVTPAPPAPAVVQYFAAAATMGSGALDSALQTLEDMRQKGAEYFATQSSAAAPAGEVLGAATENASGTQPAAYQAAGASLFNHIGSFIFQNPMYFYPVLLLICFFVLWILLKLFSRD